jgi:hypothetical protein
MLELDVAVSALDSVEDTLEVAHGELELDPQSEVCGLRELLGDDVTDLDENGDSLEVTVTELVKLIVLDGEEENDAAVPLCSEVEDSENDSRKLALGLPESEELVEYDRLGEEVPVTESEAVSDKWADAVNPEADLDGEDEKEVLGERERDIVDVTEALTLLADVGLADSVGHMDTDEETTAVEDETGELEVLCVGRIEPVKVTLKDSVARKDVLADGDIVKESELDGLTEKEGLEELENEDDSVRRAVPVPQALALGVKLITTDAELDTHGDGVADELDEVVEEMDVETDAEGSKVLDELSEGEGDMELTTDGLDDELTDSDTEDDIVCSASESVAVGETEEEAKAVLDTEKDWDTEREVVGHAEVLEEPFNDSAELRESVTSGDKVPERDTDKEVVGERVGESEPLAVTSGDADTDEVERAVRVSPTEKVGVLDALLLTEAVLLGVDRPLRVAKLLLEGQAVSLGDIEVLRVSEGCEDTEGEKVEENETKDAVTAGEVDGPALRVKVGDGDGDEVASTLLALVEREKITEGEVRDDRERDIVLLGDELKSGDAEEDATAELESGAAAVAVVLAGSLDEGEMLAVVFDVTLPKSVTEGEEVVEAVALLKLPIAEEVTEGVTVPVPRVEAVFDVVAVLVRGEVGETEGDDDTERRDEVVPVKLSTDEPDGEWMGELENVPEVLADALSDTAAETEGTAVPVSVTDSSPEADSEIEIDADRVTLKGEVEALPNTVELRECVELLLPVLEEEGDAVEEMLTAVVRVGRGLTEGE